MGKESGENNGLKEELINNLKNSGKSEDLIDEVGYEIEITRLHGELMGKDLNKLFLDIGFNSELITKHGAISLDVGYGPELAALKPFKPSTFTVTERHIPSQQLRDVEGEVAWYRTPIISVLGENMKYDLISDSITSALSQLKERNHFKVGLITWINIFPHIDIPNKEEYLEDVVKDSSEFLVKDGLMLVTAQESYACSVDTEILFPKMVNKSWNGLMLEYIRDNTYRFGCTLYKNLLIIKKQ